MDCGDCFQTAVNLQLAQDALDMTAHSGPANEESISHLLSAPPSRKQPQHLDLPRGETPEPISTQRRVNDMLIERGCFKSRMENVNHAPIIVTIVACGDHTDPGAEHLARA